MTPELAIVARGVLWGAAGGAVLGFGVCVALMGGDGTAVGMVIGAPLGAGVGVLNGLICAFALVLSEQWTGGRLLRAEAVAAAATATAWFAVWMLLAGSGWNLILAVGGLLAVLGTLVLTPLVAPSRAHSGVAARRW